MSTVPESPLALLVVGVGRSGTSLTMQTLELLGVGMPSDPNPPDENNLRGTGEDRPLEKRLVVLRKNLGGSSKLLPSSWRTHPTTQETFEWLKGYLSASAEAARPSAFAMKHPLASVFIPLWVEAAEAVGMRLRVIWATRRAADTSRSRLRRFGASAESSLLIDAERSFYILRDAPDDTLLLPYEGWHDDPMKQVAALAELAEVRDAEKIATARAAFASYLDHSQGDDDLELPPAIRDLQDVIGGQLGRLGDVLPEGSPQRLGILTALGEMVTELTRDEPGLLASSDDAVDARIDFLRVLSATNSDETRMKNELDVLTQRIREVSAENRRLQAELRSGRGNEADSGDRQDGGRGGQAARAEGGAGPRRAAVERDKAQEEVRQLKEAYAALTKAYDRLEQELVSRFHLKVSLADASGKKIAEERDNLKKLAEERRKQIATLEDRLRRSDQQARSLMLSTSWRLTAPLRRAVNMLRGRLRRA